MGVYSALTDQEKYLFALFQDFSGIDIAEFCLIDEEFPDRLVRAFPIQVNWWRDKSKHQIDQGSRSVGKALDINTPILTTQGWETMGELQVGDFVFDHNKLPTKIIKAHDILFDRPCFDIEFEDGSVITADAEHLWVVSESEHWDPEAPPIETTEIEPGAFIQQQKVLAIRPVPSVPVRCIEVESESRLFLAGETFIPTHNSMSVRYKAVAFPFVLPGAEMLVVAPEHVHLQAIMDKIETIYRNNRIPREMVAARGSQLQIARRPWNLNFKNGGRIMGRIPKHNASGFKGLHPTILEMDEAQDFLENAWVELNSTIAKVPNATWRCIAEGQFVYTNKGPVKIEDIQVGDEVLTHKNRFRKVTEVFDNGEQRCMTFASLASSLTCTPSHKIWFRTERDDPIFATLNEAVAKFSSLNSLLWFENGKWTELERVDLIPGVKQTFDLTVEEDHSYTVEGVVVSNCHGVTKGNGGTFDKHCQPGSGWTVHRLPAMIRPTWDDEERAEAIMKYGSEENFDYKRNVYGTRAAGNNANLFSIHRLLKNVDTDETSNYNEHIYKFIEFDEVEVEEIGDVRLLIDMPASHLKYKNFWIGADIGYAQAPTAICVFAEEKDSKQSEPGLRLLARLILNRISGPDQVRVFKHLVETYRPLALALDSTGAGQPLVQFLQEEMRTDPSVKNVLERIKGYNFSSNIVVDMDETMEVDEFDPEGWKEAQVLRNVKDFSSDVLRELVDTFRLKLPLDKTLIAEFQGEMWSYSQTIIDHYGKRKIYSGTAGHSLDACRMAALAFKQNGIEQVLKAHEDDWEPPPTIFL